MRQYRWNMKNGNLTVNYILGCGHHNSWNIAIDLLSWFQRLASIMKLTNCFNLWPSLTFFQSHKFYNFPHFPWTGVHNTTCFNLNITLSFCNCNLTKTYNFSKLYLFMVKFVSYDNVVVHNTYFFDLDF